MTNRVISVVLSYLNIHCKHVFVSEGSTAFGAGFSAGAAATGAAADAALRVIGFAGAVAGFAAALHDCDDDKQKQLDEMSSAIQTFGGQLAVQLDAIEQDNARKRGEIVTLVEILRAETRAPR